MTNVNDGAGADGSKPASEIQETPAKAQKVIPLWKKNPPSGEPAVFTKDDEVSVAKTIGRSHDECDFVYRDEKRDGENGRLLTAVPKKK